MSEHMVKCQTHGLRPGAIVCSHLAERGTAEWLGFVPGPVDAAPEAFCEACDSKARLEDWEPTAEQLQLVCLECFEDIGRRQSELH